MDGGHDQQHGSGSGQAANALLQAAGAFGYPEMAAVLLAQQQHMVHGTAQQQFQAYADADEERVSRGGRTRSGDSRSSSAYASRHQQAEARRRTRINERLDSLRRLVPHAERANTATFLEEVIKYIQVLQSRNQNLERTIRELQQAPLPGHSMPQPAAGAEAAAHRLPRPPTSSGLHVTGLSIPSSATAVGAQQQLLRGGTAGSSGSLGLAPQDLSASQAFPSNSFPHPGTAHLPADMPATHQMQESAAQSGAAALLAAAGAAADVGADHALQATHVSSSLDAVKDQHRSAAAAADAAGTAGAPCATVQVPDALHSLLPQGLDISQMLQQALVSAQAQLLAQLQQHQQQTSSGTAPAGAAAHAGGEDATGAAATSSGNTSGQPTSSSAHLSVLQQVLSLSGQQAASSTHHHHHQLPPSAAASQSAGAPVQPASLGMLASPPSLVLPCSSQPEAQPVQQLNAEQVAPAALQQQLLHCSAALTAVQQLQLPTQAPPVDSSLGLQAINQLVAHLTGKPAPSQAPSAAAIPTSTDQGVHRAAGGSTAGDGPTSMNSPSAAASLQGSSPVRYGAAAVLTGAAAASGGDGGAGGSGRYVPAIPNLLAMAGPAAVCEQRSSSMSGEREDDAAALAVKRRKMLLL